MSFPKGRICADCGEESDSGVEVRECWSPSFLGPRELVMLCKPCCDARDVAEMTRRSPLSQACP